MKLIKILNARKVLESMYDQECANVHLAYWMVKFLDKTQGEYKFFADGINRLISQFAEVKENGTKFVPEDRTKEFNVAVEELENTEVEDPGIRFGLSQISSLKLSMRQMQSILDFVDENK